MPVLTRVFVSVAVTFLLNSFWASDAHAQRFGDVPSNYWAVDFIETLADAGVTAGCGNGNYCPDASVSRAQMAVFIERGMNGSAFSPPAATGTVFNDVGAGDFAAAWIEQLFADGITAGCGNNNYCPNNTVTRAEMAVFLERAMRGSGYSPPAATGVFTDVSPGQFAAAWIEKLAADGITAGCGGGKYCPDAKVKRDQMAVFLVRTFNLVKTIPGAMALSPADGSATVSLEPIVSAIFSETVANATVSSASFGLSRSNNEIPAVVVLDGPNNKAKLVADKTLALLTPHTATLRGSITDLSGSALDETNWSFTTRDGSWMPGGRSIEDTDTSVGAPQIAVDPDGNAIAVWSQRDAQNQNISSIWANSYVPGDGWGAANLIEADNVVDARDPQIAMDASGNAIAVWTQWNGATTTVWSNRYVPVNGWGNAVMIETIGSGSPDTPQIAMDANGNGIAVWMQWSSDATRGIWANRNVAGNWSGATQIVPVADIADVYGLRIVADSVGNAIAVWSLYDDDLFIENVWINRYVAGAAWSGAELIETQDDGDTYDPEIAINANGDAVAVWSQWDGGPDSIWTSRFTLAGGSWSSPALLDSDAFSASVAIDANGNAIAVWAAYDDVTGRSDIYASRYAAGWSEAQRVESYDGGNAGEPRIALDARGNGIAVWSQRLGGFGPTAIAANRYVPGSGWGSDAPIQQNPANGSRPEIAVDGYGNMVVVWEQMVTITNPNGSTTFGNIFSNRFGGGGEPAGKLVSEVVFSDPFLGSCMQAAAAANSWHFAAEVTALDCSAAGVRSLGGLLPFANLQTLDLSGNQIEDIDVIGRFLELQDLDLSNNPNLTDIGPLAGLEQLTQVNLSGSGNGGLECGDVDTVIAQGATVIPPGSCRARISDLVFASAALQQCVTDNAARQQIVFADKLKVLDCDRTRYPSQQIIVGLGGLEVFENLESINLNRHDVQDLTPLAGLARLKYLDASSTDIASLEPLRGSVTLEVLTLKTIPFLYNDKAYGLEDPAGISILSSMPSLREAYLNEKDYCPSGPACTTGGGRMDCAALDDLELTLERFSRPQSCNMPIANVAFSDNNLRQCALNSGSTDTDDVVVLGCPDQAITSVVGLERFGKVISLNLNGNPIQDLTPINGMRALKYLYLDQTSITDFSALSNLVLLQDVRAENVSTLTNVHELIRMWKLDSVWLRDSGAGQIPCADLDELQRIVNTNPAGQGLFRPISCAGGPVIPPSENRSADVDGDGDDDLVLEFDAASDTLITANWDTALGNIVSFGIGGTLPGFNKAIYSRARAVALGDANNDGRDDLLLQLDSATDDSVVWRVQLSDGGGGFGSSTGSISLPQGSLDDARAIAFKDINNDGFADILIQTQVTVDVPIAGAVDVVYYYLSMGTGSGYTSINALNPFYGFELSKGRPRIIALEDVNNDGLSDLVYDIDSGNNAGSNGHCFGVRTYRPGLGFRADDGTDVCYPLAVGPLTFLDAASVADIDGNGRKELVLSFNNDFGSGFGHAAHLFLTLTFDENGGNTTWANLVQYFAELPGGATTEEYRTVAVADMNNDRRSDVLIEVTNANGAKDWIVYTAAVTGTGEIGFVRQVWWVPPLAGSSDYNAIGLLDYDNDSGSLPDLLLQRRDPASGNHGLYVARSVGSSFNSPTLWYQSAAIPRVVGVEEDGLTNLANETSELIAWVGVEKLLYTQRQFSDTLASKGLTLLQGDQLDPATPIARDACVINYAQADASLDRNNASASAEFGMLMCNVHISDRLSLRTQMIYGGCDATTGLGGTSAKCEVGLASSELEMDLTLIDGIPASQTLAVKGPNASACGGVSTKNVCANVGAELASISQTVEVVGIGAGGKLAVGVGAGADFGIEDGVLSGEIELAFLVGGSVEFSLDPAETGKFFYKVGDTSYTFAGDAGEFVVFTAGPAVYDAALEVGGLVEDAAGEAGVVARAGGGEAVYFFAGESGRQAFFIFTDNLTNTIGEIFTGLENAVTDLAEGAIGVFVDIGNGIADGAGQVWDFVCFLC